MELKIHTLSSTQLFVFLFISFVFFSGCNNKANRDLSYFYSLEEKMQSADWKLALPEVDTLSYQAIRHLDEKQDKALLGCAWWYRGQIKTLQEKEDEGKECFYAAIDFLDDTVDYAIKAKVYDHLGAIYLKDKNSERALDLFRKGYLLHLKTSDEKAIAHSLNSIAVTFIEMNEHDSAYYYLEQALSLSRQLGDSTFLLESLDSLQIQALDHKYHLKLTESELKNKHIQKVTVIVGISVFLFVTGILIYIYDRNRKKLKLKEQEYELLRSKEEIHDLNLQINNTIDSIKALQEEKENVEQRESQISRKEQELYNYQLRLYDLECRNFQRKAVYKNTLTKSGTEADLRKQIPLQDREKLQKEVLQSFSQSSEWLRITCPVLTEEDLLFCHLTKLNVSPSMLIVCMGVGGSNANWQRKYRIKKKMTEDYPAETLFCSLFGDS